MWYHGAEMVFRGDECVSAKPEMPPITDEAGVVNWFLQYDETNKDLRSRFPIMMDNTREEILHTLQTYPDADSLLAHLKEVSGFYLDLLRPQAELREKQKGPLPDETEEEAVKIVVLESVVGAKIRILRYFLSERYGI